MNREDFAAIIAANKIHMKGKGVQIAEFMAMDIRSYYNIIYYAKTPEVLALFIEKLKEYFLSIGITLQEPQPNEVQNEKKKHHH